MSSHTHTSRSHARVHHTPRVSRLRWAAIGAAVAVTLGGGGLFVANAAVGPGSTFVPVDPVRLLDTRTNSIVYAGQGTTLDVTGTGPSFAPHSDVVPNEATAVILNVTVVAPSARGFVTVRPADVDGEPTVSTVNFEAGATVANSVTVRLPAAGLDAGGFETGGTVDILFDAYGDNAKPLDDSFIPSPHTVHVLIDVMGYYIGSEPVVPPT